MQNSFSSSTSPRFRVLIVDDHPHTAATLARAIASLGPSIEVIAAESGEAALKLVQDKGVDILITDMVMPGINGLELIEKLQSHPAGRPAFNVLITAFDVPGLKETARRLKVSEVLIKPVRPEHLRQFVSRAIEGLGHALPPQPSEAKTPLKILIADDLPDNVALLKRYLENEGYVCLTAADGDQVLAQMRSEQPDLVLLDVNMPVKDGFEALQEIRSDPAIGHIPVIILTAARLDPVDMQSALNMGADDYVTKPFDRRELLARIRTRLRVKEAEDLLRRRNRELSLLPEIGRELSARLDMDELTDVILRRTVETLGALLGHICVLATRPPLHKTYRFLAGNGSQVEIPEAFLDEILEQSEKSRQGFIFDDVLKDERWQAGVENPIRSIVVVPMLGRFSFLGALVLAHERERYFEVEHELLLQAIASQAAIALENIQLHASLFGDQLDALLFMRGRFHAVLLIDENNGLRWAYSTRQDLVIDSRLVDQTFKTSDGYVPLSRLFEEARASGNALAGAMDWPDGRAFRALILPSEGDQVLILLKESFPEEEKFDREKGIADSGFSHSLDDASAIRT